MEISSSRQAAVFLSEKIGRCEVEEFWAVALNPLCRVLDARMLFRGTVDRCLIHPRDVFRFALAANATSLIVGHNHPSGLCQPSQADVQMSRKLRDAGLLLQIPLVDHVIVTFEDLGGGLEFFSFAQSFWLNETFSTMKAT